MRKKLGMMLLASSLFIFNAIPAIATTLVYDGKAHVYNEPAITLYVNGNKVATQTMNPILMDGRVLVPAREVFEPLGANVSWNAQSKQVNIRYNNMAMILTMNQTQVLKDGKTLPLDVPAKIINDKVMIPVRFISEQLGFKVEWSATTRKVGITAPESEEQVLVPVDPQLTNSINQDNNYIGIKNTHNITLTSAQYPLTQIMEVTVNESADGNMTFISASAPISSAKIELQPGKVIIDIKNSKSNLNSTITPATNAYIKSIRTSQYTTDTTRVVLDLKAGALVNASFNQDRSNIIIGLSQQQLEQMQWLSNAQNDDIFFKGLSDAQISVNQSADAKVLTFNIPSTAIKSAINWSNINSNYVDQITVSNVGSSVQGKIVLKKQVSYKFTNTYEGTTLNLSEYTGSTPLLSEKIGYLAGSKPMIELNSIKGLVKSNVKVTDDYRNKKLIFDLGANYSNQLSNQIVTINDGYIKQIEVITSGTTKINVITQKVYSYNLYEVNGKVQLQLVRPKEKYNQIIVLDIGHGGSDSGAVGNGLTEKALNLKQGLALYQLLKADPNIKVYMTRESDVYPTLQFRSALANDIEADLFVSIHNNSAASSITGTETLYYPSETDSTGKAIAQLIQNAIVKSCGTVNRGVKARSDLYVLRTTNMPAVLLETGFISNANEALLMNTSSFNSTWAKAVYNSIIESFKLL